MTANTLAPRRFTVDEYYRMAKAGILRPGDPVELLEGIIVEMRPIGSGHALCVDSLARRFILALKADQAWVRTQHPVRLSDRSEPQPDSFWPVPGRTATLTGTACPKASC